MIIVRYREIGLKGKNRSDFERKLRENIKHCLKKHSISFEKVLRTQGRILIYTDHECPQLKYVYGISSFSYAKEVPVNLETIKEEAAKLWREGTFRITIKRAQKVLMSSQELGQTVGEYVSEKTGAVPDLEKPEHIIHIELSNNHAYLYTEKNPGPGGLPTGVEGRVTLQNENSIKAGIMVLKRGVALDVVKEQDVDYTELEKFSYGFTIKELDRIPEDTDAVVVSDTLNSIKEYPYFVLRPLI